MEAPDYQVGAHFKALDEGAPLQIPMSNKSRIEFILLKCWSEFNFMPVNLQAQKLHHTYAFAD